MDVTTGGTLQIKTAAALYDLKEALLRTLCLRGTVKAHQFGGRWFITPAEMDRVFKGIKTPLTACRPKPEAIKNKISLQELTEQYQISRHFVLKDKRLKRQKLNKRWFFDRAEVELVLGSEGPRERNTKEE